MNNSTDETLMEFPCRYTVKAMGIDESNFQLLVESIIRQHLNPDNKIESKATESRKKKYLSISVTFEAHSKAQLDAIYMDLSAEPRVLVAL